LDNKSGPKRLNIENKGWTQAVWEKSAWARKQPLSSDCRQMWPKSDLFAYTVCDSVFLMTV